MKNVAEISERSTAITPLVEEPWADELDIPPEYRKHLLVKHVEGPLFFGFARSFLGIAAQAASGRLLVLRVDRVSLMDQSGAYALHDALVDLKAAGVKVVLVGLPRAQLDTLEAIRVVPDLISAHDLLGDFAALKAQFPTLLPAIRVPELAVA